MSYNTTSNDPEQGIRDAAYSDSYTGITEDASVKVARDSLASLSGFAGIPMPDWSASTKPPKKDLAFEVVKGPRFARIYHMPEDLDALNELFAKVDSGKPTIEILSTDTVTSPATGMWIYMLICRELSYKDPINNTTEK